jgi:hypothetical protein
MHCALGFDIRCDCSYGASGTSIPATASARLPRAAAATTPEKIRCVQGAPGGWKITAAYDAADELIKEELTR